MLYGAKILSQETLPRLLISRGSLRHTYCLISDNRYLHYLERCLTVWSAYWAWFALPTHNNRARKLRIVVAHRTIIGSDTSGTLNKTWCTQSEYSRAVSKTNFVKAFKLPYSIFSKSYDAFRPPPLFVGDTVHRAASVFARTHLYSVRMSHRRAPMHTHDPTGPPGGCRRVPLRVPLANV